MGLGRKQHEHSNDAIHVSNNNERKERIMISRDNVNNAESPLAGLAAAIKAAVNQQPATSQEVQAAVSDFLAKRDTYKALAITGTASDSDLSTAEAQMVAAATTVLNKRDSYLGNSVPNAVASFNTQLGVYVQLVSNYGLS